MCYLVGGHARAEWFICKCLSCKRLIYMLVKMTVTVSVKSTDNSAQNDILLLWKSCTLRGNTHKGKKGILSCGFLRNAAWQSKSPRCKAALFETSLYLPCADPLGITFKNCDTQNTKWLHYPFKLMQPVKYSASLFMKHFLIWGDMKPSHPQLECEDSAEERGLTWKHRANGMASFP